jgi:hypothetical protein
VRRIVIEIIWLATVTRDSSLLQWSRKPESFGDSSFKFLWDRLGIGAAAANGFDGTKGRFYTVRYEPVNAMLLNEFLKEHRKVEEQGHKGAGVGSDHRAAAEGNYSSYCRY